MAGAILALALLAGLVWYRSPSEPSYGGRTLSEWLERYASNPDLQTECNAAILNIGTNAVPYLLKWITYEASPRKRKLYERANRLLGRIHSTWVWRDKEEIRANCVILAFAALGPKADGAVGELSRFSQQGSSAARWRAILALPHLGEKAVPSMLPLLTNADQSVRMTAVRSIWASGTNARPVLPLLIKYTADSNKTIAYWSVVGLGDLKLEPNLAVPALINSLDDSRRELRAAAINALRAFGNASRPAIPRLRKALADSDLTVRFAVTNLLLTLDPDSLRQPAASNITNASGVH